MDSRSHTSQGKPLRADLFRLDPPDQHLPVSSLQAEVVAEDLDAVANECGLRFKAKAPNAAIELARRLYQWLSRRPHSFNGFRPAQRWRGFR